MLLIARMRPDPRIPIGQMHRSSRTIQTTQTIQAVRILPVGLTTQTRQVGLTIQIRPAARIIRTHRAGLTTQTRQVGLTILIPPAVRIIQTHQAGQRSKDFLVRLAERRARVGSSVMKVYTDTSRPRPEERPGLNYSVFFGSLSSSAGVLDCLMQTWDVNAFSLFASKFRFISSIVLPWGGPEGTNTQGQSEQPQP